MSDRGPQKHEEKSVKTKELSFATTETNYLAFLHAALAKHSREQFKVTDTKLYPFKEVGDAMDVDNSGDYKEMMKKIDDERPTVVKIFIDMKDVEKLPHGTSKRADGEGELDSTDDKALEYNGTQLAVNGGVTNLDL
ncbi:hypothetical protein PAXRUDRAFT_13785 [Paxillus rubicundulus Ve08.2h10]|uniref:Unplaced genomic scaffold scaffold_565, whole genome shotgun sequence n=1 Tax=Paxillus rubicundulus Ve08.2h10 TaxID=930991 RepID=A0A0D0DSY2_9AGAM|nr:hypothetical protein PAXRUDRAFT_13785 [Paxillus rubicundulus Ve08.2h10]